MIAQHDISHSDSGLADLLSALDQEIIEELRREQFLVDDLSAAQTLEEIGRHLCFTLAGQHLAVPLSLVIEVGELETVRALPFLPDWVEGVTNIRGEIVSVTNLAFFFNIAEKFSRKSRTVIILHENGVKTAVIIDKITGTRLLYKKDGLSSSSASLVPDRFLAGPALFIDEHGEKQLELFNGSQLLAALRF